MQNKILVTGGAGFIGSSVIERLLNSGKQVVAVDNFNDFYNPEIKENNIAPFINNKNFTLCRTDIEDFDALTKIFADNNIDCVIHLAARAGVRPSIENPISYTKTNVLGTVNILECLKKFNIKKFIFASSSSVYGNCKKDLFSEDLNLSEPISPYAASKLACEKFCYTFSKLYNITTVVLRFFTVYGPKQRPDLAINKFISLIDENKPISVYGDGSSMRDYTYIDDIVDGIISAISYDKSLFEIINLGGGSAVTLKELIETIEDATGIKAKLNFMPMQPGDVEKTAADLSKAAKLLNFSPKVTFKEGIKKYLEWRKLLHSYIK